MDPANLPLSGGNPSPAPARGSRPRIVKVRKHLASPRVRPPPPADPGPAPSSDDVRDRLYNWDPFAPPRSNAPQNPAGNLEPSTPHHLTGFVFSSGDGPMGAKNDGLGADESPLLTRLPDEIRKLNLHSGSNEEARSSNPDQSSSFFGLPDEMRKLKLQGGTENSSSGLANELRKLNLHSAGNQANCRPEADKNAAGFVFEGGRNAPAFAFGSGVKIGSSVSRNPSLGSEKGSLSQLQDELRKLNLQNAAKEGDVQKAKNDNVLGSSSSGEANKLLEELRKLGIGREETAGIKKDGSVDFAAAAFGGNSYTTSVSTQTPTMPSTSSDKGTASGLPNSANKSDPRFDFATRESELHKVGLGKSFIFENSNSTMSFGGTNSYTTSVSTQTPTMPFTSSDKGTASGLPNNTKKSDPRFDFATRESELRKVGLGKSFVFENSNSTMSFGGTTGKSNIFNGPENLATSTEQDSSSTGEPTTTFRFSFQTGNQDHSSSTGSIPNLQTQANIRPGSVATPSAYPSSVNQSACSGFTFMRMPEEAAHMEFRTQKQNTFCFSNENLSSGLHQSTTFSMRGEAKGTKTRKRRGKSRQPVQVAKQFDLKEKVYPENLENEPPGDYSPMDYSPYHENLAADQCSRETSVASEESIHRASRCSSTDSHISASMDGGEDKITISMGGREEDLVSAAQRMGINDDDLNYRELEEDRAQDHSGTNYTSGFSYERTSGLEKGSLPSERETVGLDNHSTTASIEADTGSFVLNIESEAGADRTAFAFSSSLADDGKSNFSFVASPSEHGPLSAPKHSFRRKSRTKIGQESYTSTETDKVPLVSTAPSRFPVTSTSVHSDSKLGTTDIPFLLKPDKESRAESNIKPEDSKESVTTAAASVAAQEACEKWRLRGNQAYASGYLSKAEDYYTRGVDSVSLNETSGSCIRALMLCHSNRAATRMSLGRMREAISDCKIALSIDPNFLRARVRAANCHLILGEIEDALKNFKKCLRSENDVNYDQKILLEASEGLKKAQQVADYMNQSMELLLKGTKDDARKALQIISEALSISPHSESLMEMKAEALLMLHSYEEVIQMCERTLDSAEKNSVITGNNEHPEDVDISESQKTSPGRFWRWRLKSMSYFYLGKFEEALELMQKHEKLKPIADKFGNKSQESSRSLSVTICELLRLKAAGNEAFQAGRHLEAVEHYTSALACNTESRSFTAICFCNRAAAYQALGQITDAIADCNLAIALDSSYPKAISRRATLHEMIRDYGQAASDLNRLISLLEKSLEAKDNVSGKPIRSTSDLNELKRNHIRLSTVEEGARRGIPLDMYMILGIEPTCSAADVKKAYRKAALRHHPDKAGHALTRSENVNDGLWKEVADEVHADADRLFKMIGEAYAVLSDPTKRLQYDEEEEIRSSIKKGYSGSGTPKTPADCYSNQYDRGANRRHWHWQAYGSSH